MTTEQDLTIQFELERLKRYLQENPQQADKLALNYFEDFLVLSHETKRLEQQNQALLADNQQLTSQLISSPITLSPFLSRS